MTRVPGPAEPIPSRRPARDAVDELMGPSDEEPIPSRRRPAKDAKRREFTDIELAEIIHHEFTPPADRQMTVADQDRMQIMQAMYAHDDGPRRPELSDEDVDRVFGSSLENNT